MISPGVASASEVPVSALPTMVSPLTGRPLGEDEDVSDADPVDHATAAARLGERLAKVDHPKVADVGKPAKDEAQR